MFPLFRKQMPSSASDLETALNDSFARLFSDASNPATVRDESYPQIAEIRINLDGARLRPNAPRPPSIRDSGEGGIDVRELNVTAKKISAGPASVNLQLNARDVQLGDGRTPDGDVVLVLRRAANGEVEVSADKAEIESAVENVARSEAAKHGVTIDQVKLSLASRGQRSLDAEVQLRARKLFFTTTIRIGTKLDLDEQLTARLSGMTCNGEGAIGAMACGVLQPHIAKLDGRSFSLMALPIGEVRLRDVRIAAGEQIQIKAQFGA